MTWGTSEEDRRYPSPDGEHMIVVSKRTKNSGEPKTFWKTERRKIKLTRADKLYLAERARLDLPGVEMARARTESTPANGRVPHGCAGQRQRERRDSNPRPPA